MTAARAARPIKHRRSHSLECQPFTSTINTALQFLHDDDDDDANDSTAGAAAAGQSQHTVSHYIGHAYHNIYRVVVVGRWRLPAAALATLPVAFAVHLRTARHKRSASNQQAIASHLYDQLINWLNR